MTRYAEILGGEIVGVFRNADAPDPESRMPGGDDLVMNMSIRLGSATIMASDAPGNTSPTSGLSGVDRATHARDFDRIHAALAPETIAADEMAPYETFWAERFAMFTDKYGTPWMLNFAGNKAQG